MQQCEEFRYNPLYRVGDVDLVAVELYLVALQVEVALDLREVEDAGQVEGVVHVEVDPEEWLVGERHGIEGAVELEVILILELCRFLFPERVHLIYHVVFFGVHIFAILPLLLFAEHHRYGQKLAVLLQK